MSGLRVFLAVTAAALFCSPAVLAVGPLDDDAGSGGDAGDTFATATPLLPGTHDGTLTRYADLMDVYRFEGKKGQLIQVESTWSNTRSDVVLDLFDETALEGTYRGLYGITSSGQLSAMLPRDGTWYLRFSISPLQDTDILSYAFTFQAEQKDDVFVWTSAGASALFETRVGAGESFVMARLATTQQSASQPGRWTLARDYEIEAGGLWAAGQGMTKLSAFSVSEHVAVEPSPAPPLALPAAEPIDALDGTSLILSSFHGVLDEGYFRYVAYAVNAGAEIEFIQWSERESARAAAPAGTPVAWDTENDAADEKIVTPVYAEGGASSFTVDVAGPFVGWFLLQGADGSATAPDGTVHVPEHQEPFDWITFRHPQEGTWSLERGPWSSDTLGTETVWFDGVAYPWLGIAPRDVPLPGPA